MKQLNSEQKPGISQETRPAASQRRDRDDSSLPPCQRKTTIGGQALIEGLMMIGPEKKAMAVRRLDGSIHLEYLSSGRMSKAAEIPFIRGSVRLFRQLVTGTSALMRSAELSEEMPEPHATVVMTAAIATDTDAAGPATSAGAAAPSTSAGAGPVSAAFAPAATLAAPSAGMGAAAATLTAASAAPASAAAETPAAEQPRKGAIDRFIDRHTTLMLYGSVVFGLLFSVGLFILLPNFITSFINQLTPLGLMEGWGAQVARSLIEGVIRITLFIGYLFMASRMKDIQRVWQYHGAEHKAIACYESGQPLTVENTRPFSRFHPRCGTAFMFIVIIVSIITFAFLGWHGRWVNMLIRLALVPLVAGISYEIIRLAGRHDNRFTRAISVPGLLLQRLTTAEPDDSMLEVAITAMNAVRPSQEGIQDKW